MMLRALVVFAPALLLTVQAVAVPARISPSDIFDLRTVSDPQISPDGKRVAYVVHFADIMTDRRYSNVWIVNFDGTGNRPLTAGNFADSSPRWSPDGGRLAYLSDREGPAQVFLYWMDTWQSSKVTNLQQPPSALSWSPDGKQIAFIANVPEALRKLGSSMPAPPPGAKWADPPKIIDKMVYRFNGAGYLKPGYTQVFAVSTDGRTPRQISSGNFQHGSVGGPGTAPVWTPDGKSILISANRHDDAEYAPMDTDLYEFSVTDGAVKALTNRKGPDSSPAISPDGRYIAYVGFDDRFQGHQTTQLYLMNRDGSKPRLLS